MSCALGYLAESINFIAVLRSYPFRNIPNDEQRASRKAKNNMATSLAFTVELQQGVNNTAKIAGRIAIISQATALRDLPAI